jgi:hypothetical protein
MTCLTDPRVDAHIDALTGWQRRTRGHPPGRNDQRACAHRDVPEIIANNGLAAGAS